MNEQARTRLWVIAALAAIVAGRVASAFWLWDGGYDLVSTDEALRVNIAFHWSRNPTAVPSMWPPFFFYLYGTVLAAVPDSLWAPRLVTLLLGALNAVLVFLLARRAGASRVPSLLATALVAFGPRSVRLTSVALAETLYLSCLLSAVLGFHGWWNRFRQLPTNRTGFVVLAAASLLTALAIATRYDALAFAFLLPIAAIFPRAPISVRLFRAAITCLPLVVCVLLAVHYWLTHGDPFFPFTVFSEQNRAHPGGGAPLDHRARIYFLSLLEEIPLFLPIVAAALISRHRRQVPLFIGAVAAIVLGLHVLAFLTGNIPFDFSERIVVVPLTLLAPLAAWAFSVLVTSSRRQLIWGIAVTLPLAARGIVGATEWPVPLRDTVIAARYLRSMRDSGRLPRSEKVLVELHGWEGVVLGTVSSLHDQVMVDSNPYEPAPSVFLSADPVRVRTMFTRAGVKWLLVRSPAIVERAPRVFPVDEGQTVALGEYRLMRVREK